MNYNTESLTNNHDLNLPDWGPYTKKYMGISHIADKDKGVRFDLAVYASHYRRKTKIPNVMWESDYHPWEALPNLTSFSYRQELEWKDKVFCEISFKQAEKDQYSIECEMVNDTDEKQNLVLNYMASISFPGKLWKSFEELQPCGVNLTNGIWVDALDYSELEFAVGRHTDNLNPDGYKRGEIVESGFVNASGIGCGFGNDAGDRLFYKFFIDKDIIASKIIFRYRSAGSCDMKASGIFEGDISFSGNGFMQVTDVKIGDISSGEYTLTLVSKGEHEVEIDGFAITGEDVEFYDIINNHKPNITSQDNSLILKFEAIDQYYGIKWEFADYEVREILNSELDTFMRYNTHNHVDPVLRGDGKGHFTNVFMRPVILLPDERKTIQGTVCQGSYNQVSKMLSEPITPNNIATDHTSVISAGEKYLFSQDRMAATILTNVVYPIYTKESFIRHNTPGRWWDCLYTWDSGFCGIGLAQLDLDRAIECLNAYLTEPGDEHSAFIHHGSMVPVQFYLFHEIMCACPDKELLEYFYPKLKQYYDFYSGSLGSSTTRSLGSDLIRTWDYFYNSAGWDDYPPQKYVHENGLSKNTAPVANTAHCIRIAKIMIAAAGQLGIDDISGYEDDIQNFTDSLYKYSWDEDSGYFGYVTHDEKGIPTGILRTENDINFNMGMDGLYPLVSGICSDEMIETFLEKLFDSKRFKTEIGLTTVDKSAPYYRNDGYWNGAVWMPHQWFLWKTMLDFGKHDLAFEIADTALKLWKKEVEASYNCYEHFVVESGRGAGWHQFGGLSSPVLAWFKAYYQPGTLTVGFDGWVKNARFMNGNTELDASIDFLNGGSHGIIACMDENYDYDIEWSAGDSYVQFPQPGMIFINLSGENGRLIIRAKNIEQGK